MDAAGFSWICPLLRRLSNRSTREWMPNPENPIPTPVTQDVFSEKYENVELAKILDQALCLSEEKCRYHGVDLILPETSVTSASSPKIRCRELQLIQALMNVLLSSCEAVKELPEKWIRIELDDVGESCEIRITHSGKEFPAANPGLKIAWGIVEAHQGTISVDISETQTCLRIQLPGQQK